MIANWQTRSLYWSLHKFVLSLWSVYVSHCNWTIDHMSLVQIYAQRSLYNYAVIGCFATPCFCCKPPVMLQQ